MMLTNPGSVISFQPTADTLTYEGFFGLKEKAFSLSSDPRFLYRTPSHAATFENLVAGIRRREGLLVVTGEIGVGKTTMCHAVLKNLGRKTFSSFVPDPFAAREDLLKTLLIDFGVLTIEELTTGAMQRASRTELSYLLSNFLESLATLDAFVVVFIDEAQNMSLPLIEETRILSDSFGAKGRLQIVFIGQPELRAKLKLPEMRQVDQRVCGYNHLEPLRREDVAGYIEHRLHVAGGSRDRVLFSPGVLDILHSRSGGVPRLVNRICDRALHLAHLRQAAGVDREMVEAALIEVGSSTLTPTWASIVAFSQPEANVQTSPPAVPSEPIAPAPVEVIEAPVETVEAPAEAIDTPAARVSAESDLMASLEQLDAQPQLEDAESFDQRIDEWVAQELAPVRRQTPSRPVAEAVPVRKPAALRTNPVRRAARPTSSWSDPLGDLRPETYMQRMARVWARRIATAAVCFAALTAGIAALSIVPETLAGLSETPAILPEVPATPTLVIAGLEPPTQPSAAEALPAEMPPAVALPTQASGRYLVSVGLFASRDRADRLVQVLSQAGLTAAQRPFQLRRQAVQQVVLGPFADRSDAVAELGRLRRLGGYNDANVVDSPAFSQALP